MLLLQFDVIALLVDQQPILMIDKVTLSVDIVQIYIRQSSTFRDLNFFLDSTCTVLHFEHLSVFEQDGPKGRVDRSYLHLAFYIHGSCTLMAAQSLIHVLFQVLVSLTQGFLHLVETVLKLQASTAYFFDFGLIASGVIETTVDCFGGLRREKVSKFQLMLLAAQFQSFYSCFYTVDLLFELLQLKGVVEYVLVQLLRIFSQNCREMFVFQFSNNGLHHPCIKLGWVLMFFFLQKKIMFFDPESQTIDLFNEFIEFPITGIQIGRVIFGIFDGLCVERVHFVLIRTQVSLVCLVVVAQQTRRLNSLAVSYR